MAHYNPEVLEIALAVIRTTDGVVWIERGHAPSIGYWALPGGHIEAGEDPLTAARRETAEETGLIVTAGTRLAVLREAFFDTAEQHLYDVLVHVALFDDPGGPLLAGDGVTAAVRAPHAPAPALAPDARLATLAAAPQPHTINARIRLVGDALMVLSWIAEPYTATH